jgi:hypothetical protein
LGSDNIPDQRRPPWPPQPIQSIVENVVPQAQGPLADLALHTLGWKAFQDLAAQICEECLGLTVSIYREAQDGGQDAVFLVRSKEQSNAIRVATVQCKFSSDPRKHLRLSDFSGEEKNVEQLVRDGEAHIYYLITNIPVDAPQAALIRARLSKLGVGEQHVLGKEWITAKVRESARLRALVPRIYGLGDLSIILDERRASKTKALLGHLMSGLSVYVPTSAHRTAVRVLSEHGVVLLLGAPATGKSMLAAILATTALDDDGHRCFQVDNPSELISHWNPHERGGFYWIDDAFGANQLREDYVEMWIAIMNKIKAAITAGNRFVLTSRSHIWLGAKAKLATRNHPLLANGKAVVNVGALSPEERSQILYNHIKAGNQTLEWKQRVKPHLENVATQPNLLPEIARRLGDRNYTSGLRSLPADLLRFVSQPMEFLIETISELNDAQKAALTIVFLHRSRMPTQLIRNEQWNLVCDKYGVSQLEIGDALDQLKGSFLVLKTDSENEVITFAHPTFADALSAILAVRPDLIELYIRGTRVEAILTEVVCEGAKSIRDAIVVPATCNDVLIARISECPDETGLNNNLFGFLYNRASEMVLRAVIKTDERILGRHTGVGYNRAGDIKVKLYSRVHSLGLLPDDLREDAAFGLESALLNRLDGSFLDEDEILALFTPRQLLAVAAKLLEQMDETIANRIKETVSEADLDIEPEDNFEDVTSFLRAVEWAFPSDGIEHRIVKIKQSVTSGIEKISEKRNERTDWGAPQVAPSKVSATVTGRSIFIDVDL